MAQPLAKKIILQGIFPLVLIGGSAAYIAQLYSFTTGSPTIGGLLLVALFAAVAAKAGQFLSQKKRLEEDFLGGLLLVLSAKALSQALAWGVCGTDWRQTLCGTTFQGLEFLTFAFLALYYSPLWIAGFAIYAGALELGFAAGPAVLHAAAEPEIVMAALPAVSARLVYDLLFGVAFGWFVQHERMSRDDAVGELQRLARDAKSFRLDEVVANPEGGLEAMSRAGREDAEKRAVTRLREKEGNIARFLKQTLRCYSAVIFRYDASADLLELRAWRTDSRNLGGTVNIKPGEGMIGWIFKKREFLQLGESSRPLADLPYYKKDDEGVFSFLGCPIVDMESDRVLGVLAVDSREVGVFGEEHRSTLNMAAHMFVEAVRNEESRTRQETEALQLQAMLELSRQMGEELDVGEVCKRVVLSMHRIVPYQVAAIALFDPEKNIYRVEYGARSDDGQPVEAADLAGLEMTSGEETVVSLAMRQDTPFLIAGYRQRDKSKRVPLLAPGLKMPDLDSILAVPFKRGDQDIGCLVLGALGNDVFEETERRLFGILGNLFAASMRNAQVHRATEERASTDPLTGLANREKYREFFAHHSALAKRTKQPVSILMMDLDHFKKVNDTYGHPGGDAVLVQLAEILKREVRETDLAARYGGEEFLSVLVNASRKDALRQAERIRKGVESHAFQLPDGRTMRATLSIGVATYPEDTNKEDTLPERADQALYGAKSAGRNRVQLYSDLPDRAGTTSWSERKEPKAPAEGGAKPWRFGA